MSSSVAITAWVSAAPRCELTRTALREKRSATAPPKSWNSPSGTVYAASTMPRSPADPLASRIAKVSATQTIELPVIDTSRPAKNQRNCWSFSGCATGASVPTSSLTPRVCLPGRSDQGMTAVSDPGWTPWRTKIGLRSDADGGVLPAA